MPAKITGGTVSIMERRKLAEYEHREARAELSFGAEDGDYKAVFAEATAAAVAQVQAMLAGEIRRPGPGRPPGAPNKPKPAMGERVHGTAGVSGAAEGGHVHNPAADPSAVEEPAADPAAVSTEQAVADDKLAHGGPESDPAAVVDEAALPPVTDADLGNAIARQNDGTQDRIDKIKDLIYLFAGPKPNRSQHIPQAQRRNFLKRLEKGLWKTAAEHYKVAA